MGGSEKSLANVGDSLTKMRHIRDSQANELLVPSRDSVLGQRVPDLAHLAGRVADVLLRALVRTLVLVLHGAVAPVQDLQKIDR